MSSRTEGHFNMSLQPVLFRGLSRRRLQSQHALRQLTKRLPHLNKRNAAVYSTTQLKSVPLPFPTTSYPYTNTCPVRLSQHHPLPNPQRPPPSPLQHNLLLPPNPHLQHLPPHPPPLAPRLHPLHPHSFQPLASTSTQHACHSLQPHAADRRPDLLILSPRGA